MLLEEGVCYDQCVLLAKSVSLWPALFCIPIPYDGKDIFFLVTVLEGLVGLHRTSEFQLLWH